MCPSRPPHTSAMSGVQRGPPGVESLLSAGPTRLPEWGPASRVGMGEHTGPSPQAGGRPAPGAWDAAGEVLTVVM